MPNVYPLATQSLQDYANSSATANGIPPDFFSNMIGAESGWNPEALSSKGAQGITQIVPRYHPGVDPWDPYASISYAAETIRGYYDRFGSWDSAFAAWNAGPGAVSKYGGVPPYTETENYVKKITGGKPPSAGVTSSSGGGKESLSPSVDTSAPGLPRMALYAAGIALLILGFRNLTKG